MVSFQIGSTCAPTAWLINRRHHTECDAMVAWMRSSTCDKERKATSGGDEKNTEAEVLGGLGVKLKPYNTGHIVRWGGGAS